MFETTRFEAEQRLPASGVIAFVLCGFAGMVLLIAPGLVEDVDIEGLLDQFPPAFVEAFGLDQIGTLEGFIAIELYQFVWLIGLGGYLAYAGAGTIASDVETGRMDTLLAAPIARYRLLIEKYIALLTPILVVNVAVFLVMYVGTILIDEPLAFTDLAAVHLLSIPYLLCCGAIGMLASVAATREMIAEGIAAAVIVAAFLVHTLVRTTDFSWLGALTPMRYYDPLSILTMSTYDIQGALVLLGGAVVLLLASAWRFSTEDVR